MHSLLRLGLIVVSLLALFPPSVRSQIYFTSQRAEAIYRVDFDGRNLRSMIDLDSALGSADYWPYGITVYGSQLYWTDVEQEAIYTASLDGSEVRKLIDLRPAFPFSGFSAEGIVVTEDTIFWTDSLNTGVYAARRDGSNPRQILDRGDEQPLQMLVDGDRLLWTQWVGSNAGVYSSDFDGADVRRLAAGHGDVGPGIALAEGRLFWIYGYSIYTAARDGSGFRELIDLQSAVGGEQGIAPRDLAVHEGQLYWTDVNRDGLFTARIDGSGTRKLLDMPGDPSIRWSGSYLAIMPPPVPEIHVRSSGGEVEIEFTGTLQSTEDLVTWSDVEPAPSSPYRIAPTTRARFFRARGRE